MCVYWVLSVQGDLMIDDSRKGPNSDDDAIDMFLNLVGQTKKSIVIHDDGNNFPDSIYNNDQVLTALRCRIESHDIEIRCLFNDEGEELKLLDLVREYPRNIQVAYIKGGRTKPDTHYKIVDKGKLVHLSAHEHGKSEREFVLRKPPPLAIGTRKRISKAFMQHYRHALRNATHLRV